MDFQVLGWRDLVSHETANWFCSPYLQPLAPGEWKLSPFTLIECNFVSGSWPHTAPVFCFTWLTFGNMRYVCRDLRAKKGTTCNGTRMVPVINVRGLFCRDNREKHLKCAKSHQTFFAEKRLFGVFMTFMNLRLMKRHPPPLWEPYWKILENLIITLMFFIPGNKTVNQLNISVLWQPIESAWLHATKTSASEQFPTLSCSSSVLSLFSQHLSPHSDKQHKERRNAIPLRIECVWPYMQLSCQRWFPHWRAGTYSGKNTEWEGGCFGMIKKMLLL